MRPKNYHNNTNHSTFWFLQPLNNTNVSLSLASTTSLHPLPFKLQLEKKFNLNKWYRNHITRKKYEGPSALLTTFLTRSLAAGVPPITDSGRYGLLTRTSFITTMTVLSQRTGSLIICIYVIVKCVKFSTWFIAIN